MGHYIHKSIPDAKCEADSSSTFGDMTSQNFPRKKGNESSNSAIYPREMGLTFKKMSFYVQNRSSRPKIDPPHVNFSNFQTEEFFFIFKILGRFDEKRAAAIP